MTTKEVICGLWLRIKNWWLMRKLRRKALCWYGPEGIVLDKDGNVKMWKDLSGHGRHLYPNRSWRRK